MEREGFMFFASFRRTAKKIKDPLERLAYLEAVMDYGITREANDLGETIIADVAFESAKATLDSSWDKAIAGSKGGKNKAASVNSEAKTKQNGKCLTEQNKRNGEGLSENTKQSGSISKSAAPDSSSNKNKNKNKDKTKNKDIDKTKTEEKEKDENEDSIITPNGVCAESEADSTPAEPQGVPFITLPLNDGAEYPVQFDSVSEWEELYPSVDVMQELRNMRGWLLSNPARRKTKSGISRFITSWLSREQDKGAKGKSQRGQPKGSTAQMLDDFYSMAEEWARGE